MLLIALALCQSPPADTKAFLDPANWEGRTDIWTVADGKIVGETKEDPKYNTFLVSKAKYSDFELSFTTKLRDGVGNSGVQVRSKLTDPKLFKVAGPQVDIGKGYWGSLYGEGVGGMMKASDKKLIEAHVKEKEANDYRVRVVGSRYKVTVNGQVFIDADFPTLPPGKGEKEGKPAPADGIIAFQVHQGYPKMRIEFSDIKFENLSKR